jgi:hypothetical protein
MKILLQHQRNKLYFRRMGVWTSNPHAAFDFEHSERAIAFALAHDLKDVQLVLKFADAQCDQVVPMPERLPASEPQAAA